MKDTWRNKMVAPPTRLGKKKAAKAKARATAKTAAKTTATVPSPRFSPAPNFDPAIECSFNWYLSVFKPGSPFNATLQEWAQNGHDPILLAQQAAWETLRYGIFLALSGDSERLDVFAGDQPVLDDAITTGAEYVTAVCKNIMSGKPVGDAADRTPACANQNTSGSINGKEANDNGNNGYSLN